MEHSNDSPTCEVGTAVLVDFVGRQASSRDHEDGPIFHVATDLLIVVGDKDVIPALEMGIRFLREGSRGIIYSHSKYAYGTLTRVNGEYELPENSSVMYQVHVKKIVEASDVEIAQSRKEIANDCYKHEWSKGNGKNRPLHLYKKASEAMDNWLVSSPDDELARSIMVDCLNNMAAVHLRAREYGKAKEAATRVLMHDPDNVKALCRAARAAMLDPAGSYEESDAAISAAESVKADDPDVIKLRTDLERRKREYKKKSKAMFSKLGRSDKVKKDVSLPDDKSELMKNEDKKSEDTSERGTEKPDERRESQSWSKVLRPIILQMAVSFIALFVFQYIAKQKNMEGGHLSDHIQKEMESNSEF